MNHGYVIVGRDDILGKVSYGSFSSLKEAKMSYRFLCRSTSLSDKEKDNIKLVELVEKEISPV